jgi:hypothetical protein
MNPSLIDQAVALLNAESIRLFGEPMDSEQVEACSDEDQAFAMLDDMESRMGFNVTDARCMLACHFEGEEY